MSPIVAYHATHRKCRKAIEHYGLLCHSPAGRRPFGVYVFRSDGAFNHVGWNSRTEWYADRAQDLWRVAYIGPMIEDQYVLNAMILLMPAEQVTLVTGNR